MLGSVTHWAIISDRFISILTSHKLEDRRTPQCGY